MNRAKCKDLRQQIQSALNDIADGQGLTLEIGNISFDEDGFTTRLTCKEGTEDEALKRDFDKVCRLFDHEPSDFRKDVFLGANKNHLLYLIGFNTKAPKNCVILESAKDGKHYRCNLNTLKRNS
jgi:hypothetical protein